MLAVSGIPCCLNFASDCLLCAPLLRRESLIGELVAGRCEYTVVFAVQADRIKNSIDENVAVYQI